MPRTPTAPCETIKPMIQSQVVIAHLRKKPPRKPAMMRLGGDVGELADPGSARRSVHPLDLIRFSETPEMPSCGLVVGKGRSLLRGEASQMQGTCIDGDARHPKVLVFRFAYTFEFTASCSPLLV